MARRLFNIHGAAATECSNAAARRAASSASADRAVWDARGRPRSAVAASANAPSEVGPSRPRPTEWPPGALRGSRLRSRPVPARPRASPSAAGVDEENTPG